MKLKNIILKKKKKVNPGEYSKPKLIFQTHNLLNPRHGLN
jgi:hypothetical protein